MTDGHDDFETNEPPHEASFWPSDPYQRPMPSPYPSQAPHPGPDYWYPPEGPRFAGPQNAWPSPQRGKSRRSVAGLAAVAVVAAAIGAAVIGFSGSGNGEPRQASVLENPFSPQEGGGFPGGSGNQSQESPFGNDGGGQGQQSPYGYGYGGGQGQTSPFGSGGASGSGGGTSAGTTQATSAQEVGIVDINTVIDYGQEQAAGTGMILTSNGEILTNNHVVNGATTISITVISTGKTYSASVVGTDPTDDVAVLQLSRASGLMTAKLGDSSKVAVGDNVTAVGNAGGTGGTPSAAKGAVTALNQTLTASDQDGSGSETLTGMIQVNADVQAGDSGGPLYSANNTVIGMDTAASAGSQATPTGFAIPIAKATSIAQQIESGSSSNSNIHTRSAGFLGVQLSPSDASGFSSSGAAIVGVIPNSAAAGAGLQAGDTITAVNGTAVSNTTAVTAAISGFQAGKKISITWLDSARQSHTATVTLGAGPAD
jgi:S1-C subfamily serine protease